MKQLRQEIGENYERFAMTWPTELEAIRESLKKHDDKYAESYVRLVSFQAWRTSLLEPNLSSGSQQFFLEAQNDMLVSHVLANLGSWRVSLKSLRSAVENVLFCLFYMDHPVELEQWESGNHRLGFSAAITYLTHHPRFAGVDDQLSGLALLKEEYATLSKAVHGSAIKFRMTADGEGTQLWSDEPARVGSWATRERAVVLGLNLILLTMFRHKLTGASLPNLRKAISFAVPEKRHAVILERLGVALVK